MKEGDNIRFIVISYFVIGIVIGLTQLGLNKLFEPPCSGVVKHTLWERGHSEDAHLLWRAGSSVLQWLPDLYSRVLKGDMTARDYLLGGYHCEPAVALKPTFPLPLNDPLCQSVSSCREKIVIPRGLVRPPEIPSQSVKPLETSGFGGLSPDGDRAPGSQAEALVRQTPPAAPNPTPASTLNLLESGRNRTGETPTTPHNSWLTDEVSRNLLGVKQTPSPVPTVQPSQK